MAVRFYILDKLIGMGIKKISISYNGYLSQDDGQWVCDIEKMNITTRAQTKEMAICLATLGVGGSQK